MSQATPKDPATPVNGVLMDFAAGTVIFREGDAGGDLYFIKEGEVEVFRTLGELDIPLALLKPGEVLGIMTCLTREPRLASARSVTAVKALVVKQAGLKTLISGTPPWVHAVIKDFTVRIKAMDELYGFALQRVDNLELESSSIRLAVRVAKGVAEVGAMIATRVGEVQVVDVDKALTKLAAILDVAPEAVATVFNVFLESGLLRAEANAEVHRADLAVLERLAGFATVARPYLSTPKTRVAYEALFGKDCAFLQGVCDVVKAQRLKLSEECRLPLSRLAVNEFSAEFAAASFRRAADVGFVKLESSDSETLVVFTPATLLTAVHSLMAISKLRGADWIRRQPTAVAAVVA